MHEKGWFGRILAGCGAGIVNGLFGAGGGMILVPLLSKVGKLNESELFPASVAVILPICLVSLSVSHTTLPWASALPYLIGSIFGGVAAGLWGKKIPVLWLHRILGAFILWGGIRYLC